MSLPRSTTAAVALILAGAASTMATPVLEPTTQKFIDGLAGSTPIYKLSPEAARKVLHNAQSGPVALPNASVEDRTLPVGPKGQTRIQVIRPEGGEGPLRPKLTEAGVTVTTTRYLSTIHDFVMLNALGDTPAAKTAIEQATDFLRSALTSVK